jgi:hypothetical protein
MPLVQIAVDIAAPTGGSDHESNRGGCDVAGRTGPRPGPCSVLIEACTAAASPALCVLAEDADSDAALTVLVLWRGRRHARIQVVSGAPSGKRWMRDLEFGASDVTLEKWRSVGYAIGTLGGEVIASRSESTGRAESGHTEGAGEQKATGAKPDRQDASPRSSPQASPKESSTPKRAPPKDAESVPTSAAASAEPSRPSSPRTLSPWSAEAGAFLSPSSPLAIGAFARASRAFDGPFVTLGVSYSVRGEDARGVSVHAVTPSAGAGWEFSATSWLSCRLRAEVLAEQMTVQVVERTTARRDRQSRWLGGARLGGEFATPPGSIGVLAGAEATVRSSPTDIQVGTDADGTIPLLAYALLAGLRAEWR